MRKIGQRSIDTPPFGQDAGSVRGIRREQRQREESDSIDGHYNDQGEFVPPSAQTVRLHNMYPVRNFPGRAGTMGTDVSRMSQGVKSVVGRRIDQGSIERGGGQIHSSGHTHARQRSGIRRMKGGRIQ